MNKTLRNKALKDVNRLITATLNGENWAAPDGYFAVAYNIYDGYKVKKDQYIPDGKPDLNAVLASNSEYVGADVVDFLPTGIDGTNRPDVNRITSGDNYWDVNADYYNLIKNIYPDAKLYVDKTGYNFTPVEVKQDNTLVAVIMPLKR